MFRFEKTRPLLYVMFGLSGFAGLIYESVWSHYIKLILGHAAYAQTLVLAIFMGGLALGAWLISRLSAKISNPLLWYAGIEFVIGLFGLGFHYEFLTLEAVLYNQLLPLASGSWLAGAAKLAVGIVLLLPQAILLGATFPLMSACILRWDQQSSGRVLGTLYFSNSFGAVFGVLASGFWLIPNLGLPGSSFTAGLINIGLAIVLFPVAKPLGTGALRESQSTGGGGLGTILLAIACLTGLASFIYEIAWIRMLSLVLGSSTHAFELMLSAFILGLALGSLYIRRRADQIPNSGLYLGRVQILMGVFAAATIPLYTQSFDLMGILISELPKSEGGYLLFNLGSHAIALIIMLPATFLAGMTLPLITHTLVREDRGEPAIGRVYAANTIGAIAGVVVAIYFLLPSIGVKGAIIVGAAIDVVAGLVLLVRYRTDESTLFSRWVPITLASMLLVGISQLELNRLALSSGVYRTGNAQLQEDNEVLYYRDGKTASISLVKHPDSTLTIRTNGKPDAAIAPTSESAHSDETTMIMLAMLPLSYKPDARTVANIGFGSGLTTHALLSVETIERVDNIEIEQFMVDAASGFGDQVNRAYSDPRSSIIIDDAKSHISSSGELYDIVISEPSNPWISGVGALFSKEFYRYIDAHLVEGGLFVQWLQLYEINQRLIGSVVKNLNREFNDYHIYNTDYSNMLVIASDKKLPRLNNWLFHHPQAKTELGRVSIEGVGDFGMRYLGSKDTLGAYFEDIGYPANSDFYPVLAYRTPQSRFMNENATGVSELNSGSVPFINWIEKIPYWETDSLARKHYFSFRKQASATPARLLDVESIEDSVNRDAIKLLKMQLVDCGLKQRVDPNLIPALFTAANLVNGNANKIQERAFWDRLLNTCDLQGLDVFQMNWLSLHRSISFDEYQAVRDLAGAIMRESGRLPWQAYDYLLTAMLAANLALDEPDASLSYIEEYFINEVAELAPTRLNALVSLTRARSR